jgi:hypothetical protein
MALKTWPIELQREQSILWELTGTTISGGQTSSGIMPMTRLDGGGLWKATLNDVSLVEINQVLAWRATAAYCDGGAQPIILPMCDLRHAPIPLLNGKRIFNIPDVPHSDNSPFDDDAPYQHNLQTTIIATADGPIGLRSTSIAIHVTVGGQLKGGQYFSIDHPTVGPRLYRIVEITFDFGGGGVCTIRPPLREALTEASTPVEFNHPACVMRLASVDAMDLTLQMRKYGTPTVNFIEAFPPFPP